MEMGADRILFSVDYPFVPNPPGVKWMEDRAARPRGPRQDPARQRDRGC